MELQAYKNIFKGDKVIWIIYFFLSLISIIEVFSATSTLSYKSGDHWGPIINHGIYIFIGALVVWGVHLIPCKWFKVLPVLMLPVAWLALIAVMFFGESVNGASRTLTFGGVNIQPSEIGKAAVILSVSLILSRMQGEKQANRKAFKYIMWITGITCALIAPENLSTAGLLFGVVFLMMFIGRVSMLQLGKLIGVIGLFAAAGVTLIMYLPTDNKAIEKIPLAHRVVTWKNRLAHFSTEKDTLDLTGKDAQTAYANIAIATSNVVGKLPGNSVQCDFLPQAYSDFIYAIIIEELGLVGGFAVLMLYIFLLIRAGRIASHSERNFPAFLIMGLALLLVSQALINMMVAVGLFPVTGQPLPLVSRGGSSMLTNCFYIGIMLSISRYVIKKQNLRNGIQEVETEPSMTNEYYNDENMK